MKSKKTRQVSYNKNYAMRNTILRMYLHESAVLERWETVAAPSGEWEEYNYDYLAQEAIVSTLEDVLHSIKGM